MIAASDEERIAMRAFFRALATGPLELAHRQMAHPHSAETLSFAQPPGLQYVVAWLTDEEAKTITMVGIAQCVDGLIFNSAQRAASEDA